jgi:uncharacterized SAM-binding protein YcdF (DUF218 family)
MLRLVALLFIAWLVGAAYLFVLPHDDRPVRADAVVVLSGTRSRLATGERLMRRGYAPTLVVSRSANPDALERHACAGRAICFRADPYSTRGEARAIARLAKQHGWRSVDVVTSKYHDFRAGILIRRCYHGELRMVGAPQSSLHLPIDMVKESVKLLVQETLERGC